MYMQKEGQSNVYSPVQIEPTRNESVNNLYVA